MLCSWVVINYFDWAMASIAFCQRLPGRLCAALSWTMISGCLMGHGITTCYNFQAWQSLEEPSKTVCRIAELLRPPSLVQEKPGPAVTDIQGTCWTKWDKVEESGSKSHLEMRENEKKWKTNSKRKLDQMKENGKIRKKWKKQKKSKNKMRSIATARTWADSLHFTRSSWPGPNGGTPKNRWMVDFIENPMKILWKSYESMDDLGWFGG